MSCGKCKMCKDRVKNWEGSDPVCYFDDTSNNWNCATINEIRDLAEKPHPLINFQYCQDEKYSVICIDSVDMNDKWVGFALFVQWYKRRGRTESVKIIGDAGVTRDPTEDELLAIINYFEKIL